MEFYAYSRLHQAHVTDAEKQRHANTKEDVLGSLSTATKEHSERRAAQSKFNADKASHVPKIQRSEFAKSGDPEGFEHLLEPHELQEWKDYQAAIKQAIYDAKTGKGPKPEENAAIAEAMPGLPREKDALTLLMEKVQRSKSATQKLKTKLSNETEAAGAGSGATTSSSSPAAKHGRRAAAGADGHSSHSRAYSGRASQANVFMVCHKTEEEPLLPLEQPSMLEMIRAKMSITEAAAAPAAAHEPVSRLRSAREPKVPLLQPLASMARTTNAPPVPPVTDAAPLMSAEAVSPRPKLQSCKSTTAVRFEEPAASDDDEEDQDLQFFPGSCDSPLQHPPTRASLGGTAMPQFGRRSRTLDAVADQSPSRSRMPCELRASGGHSTSERPATLLGLSHVMQPQGRVSLQGSAVLPGDPSSPFTAMMQQTDAARHEFMRLLHGGSSGSFHSNVDRSMVTTSVDRGNLAPAHISDKLQSVRYRGSDSGLGPLSPTLLKRRGMDGPGSISAGAAPGANRGASMAGLPNCHSAGALASLVSSGAGNSQRKSHLCTTGPSSGITSGSGGLSPTRLMSSRSRSMAGRGGSQSHATVEPEPMW